MLVSKPVIPPPAAADLLCKAVGNDNLLLAGVGRDDAQFQPAQRLAHVAPRTVGESAHRLLRKVDGNLLLLL